jgi:pyrimidine-nucleoside phosphorylase
MTPYEIIAKKRDGLPLSQQEIYFFINGFVTGMIPDYQMSALLMAIYFRGMSKDETYVLMETFLNSGKTVTLDELDKRKIDKHSTGGVGDKISIILVPIVAAAGVAVPMISGRGLGHTGGTLDKLESILGFRTDYSVKEYRRIIAEVGACMIGQTPELTPADKMIYALRDVTATIQSVPLIAASIMSKKLAEGIDALVLDIKTGKGAFMTEFTQAENLAKILIQIGEEAGLHTIAYITNMDSPLGTSVGNWLEIQECIRCLQGDGPADLMQLTLQFSGAMLYLGEIADSIEMGIDISEKMIKTGSAWEKFLQIITAQEGDLKIIRNPNIYPSSKIEQDISAPHGGWIKSIDALEVGLSAVQLGAGRRRAEDTIDHKSGIIIHKKTGEKVCRNEKIMTICTDNPENIDDILLRLSNAVEISDNPVDSPLMILKYLDKSNL